MSQHPSCRTLFLEGASGISGDMTVAALLDLGANQQKLEKTLKSLGIDGFQVEISTKSSHGLAGKDFNVRLLEEDCHSHPHEHGHHHDEAGHHHHHHDHDHVHSAPHAHTHRNLEAIEAILDRGEMTERARGLAKKIFRVVAEAEAKAHGVSIQEVHFHEVGAIDSIVDIVSTAVCIDDLSITECIVTGLSEGTGSVRCQHGVLPVPVPAVMNIAATWNIPLRICSDVQGEMVTPTGIAIAAALKTQDALPKRFTVVKTGIGLGKRDFGRPNMLRAWLVSPLDEAMAPSEMPDRSDGGASEEIYLLECNVDDATGEELGLAMGQLMAAGARDVHFVPCFMKKNRPAWLVRVLCDAHLIPEMERRLFAETTTIGIRMWPVERTCMTREVRQVWLPKHQDHVAVKVCRHGSVTRAYPEYESVRALAEASSHAFREVYAEAVLMASALDVPTSPDSAASRD